MRQTVEWRENQGIGMGKFASMNGPQRSLLLSIMLHGIVGGSIYFMSITFAHPVKTIFIDLTVSPEGPEWEVSSAKGVNAHPLQVAKGRRTESGKSLYIPPSRPVETRERIAEATPAHPAEGERKMEVPPAGVEGPTAHSLPAAQGTNLGTKGRGETTISGLSAAGEGTVGRGKSREELRNGYLKEHFAYIKDIIQRNISYPPRARRRGWSGRVVVSFVIDEQGRTFAEKILESSGFDLLDDNVIETVREVTPFPRPPVKAELRVPIIYRLE
jgi:periplasmic protein TonB